MKQHLVYFYGSTKIIRGFNSLSEESCKKRNQIIGFEGIDSNPELIEFGEICFNKTNENGHKGETGTLFPKNITIVPFRYLYNQEIIINQLEDVIIANENYIKADIIKFPIMMLKYATTEGRNELGKDEILSSLEKDFKNEWCCFGHYYIYLLRKALSNKGYFAFGISEKDKYKNLINEKFSKKDGTRLIIHADAGL